MSATNGQQPHTHETQPGDGYRYTVLIGDLPHHGFMGGGSPEDYAVVTVWFPGGWPDGVGRTYVMAKRGTLTTGYVAEKFCSGIHPDDRIIGHVADAIRGALGRPGLE